jgi:hypothetical protein
LGKCNVFRVLQAPHQARPCQADILSYPDKSAIGYETYAEADEAGAEFLKSGIDGCIWYEVRRIY